MTIVAGIVFFATAEKKDCEYRVAAVSDQQFNFSDIQTPFEIEIPFLKSKIEQKSECFNDPSPAVIFLDCPYGVAGKSA